MIYLACPYLDPDPSVRQLRFHAAIRAAASIIASEQTVFCPVIHAHPLVRPDHVAEWAYWGSGGLDVLPSCSAVYVLTLPGWETSADVQEEIARAESLGIPLYGIEPENHAAINVLTGIENARQP